MHPLRLGILAASLLALLAGGLVVSTKIGGGGDLHNMDAYIVMLGILGAYALWGSARLEGRAKPARSPAPWPSLLVLAIVPVGFALLRLSNRSSFDGNRAAMELSALRSDVQSYSESGPVLFMYERHLLTFGLIPNVQLIPEYEVVTLMEMAISGNEPYLNQYYDDLAAHRFSAIVAHPQNLGVETGDFIEENNAWNRLVGQPLLCQYKPAATLDYSHVQVLIPRQRPCQDFPPQVDAD